MTYKDHDVNCDNYPWLIRVLSKPHHEIENDPGVWERVDALIDYEVSAEPFTAEATSFSALRTE